MRVSVAGLLGTEGLIMVVVVVVVVSDASSVSTRAWESENARFEVSDCQYPLVCLCGVCPPHKAVCDAQPVAVVGGDCVPRGAQSLVKESVRTACLEETHEGGGDSLSVCRRFGPLDRHNTRATDDHGEDEIAVSPIVTVLASRRTRSRHGCELKSTEC